MREFRMEFRPNWTAKAQPTLLVTLGHFGLGLCYHGLDFSADVFLSADMR